MCTACVLCLSLNGIIRLENAYDMTFTEQEHVWVLLECRCSLILFKHLIANPLVLSTSAFLFARLLVSGGTLSMSTKHFLVGLDPYMRLMHKQEIQNGCNISYAFSVQFLNVNKRTVRCKREKRDFHETSIQLQLVLSTHDLTFLSVCMCVRAKDIVTKLHVRTLSSVFR